MITIKLSGGGEISIDKGGISSEGLKGTDVTKQSGYVGRSLPDFYEYNAAMDGLESLLLALYCAGVDLSTDEVTKAVEVAIESIANNF